MLPVGRFSFSRRCVVANSKRCFSQHFGPLSTKELQRHSSSRWSVSGATTTGPLPMVVYCQQQRECSSSSKQPPPPPQEESTSSSGPAGQQKESTSASADDDELLRVLLASSSIAREQQQQQQTIGSSPSSTTAHDSGASSKSQHQKDAHQYPTRGQEQQGVESQAEGSGRIELGGGGGMTFDVVDLLDLVPERHSAGTTTPAERVGEASQVRDHFAVSVKARTVGNAMLCRYLRSLSGARYDLAIAAVEGAKSAGLVPNAETNDRLLDVLLDGQQLRHALELYQHMIKTRSFPNTPTYNKLMKLCVDREVPSAAARVFSDMQKRGRYADAESYEVLMTALSLENPPKWEKAVEIFDKLQGDRNRRVTCDTYKALMRVYLNMQPFDWRIVYNAYYEMRCAEPKIPLDWEAYNLVVVAFKRGQAGYLRRFLTWVDAWVQITPMFSASFFGIIMVYMVIIILVKFVGGYLLSQFMPKIDQAAAAQPGGMLMSGVELRKKAASSSMM